MFQSAFFLLAVKKNILASIMPHKWANVSVSMALYPCKRNAFTLIDCILCVCVVSQKTNHCCNKRVPKKGPFPENLYFDHHKIWKEGTTWLIFHALGKKKKKKKKKLFGCVLHRPLLIFEFWNKFLL